LNSLRKLESRSWRSKEGECAKLNSTTTEGVRESMIVLGFSADLENDQF
jgi:hypothetical protein